MCYSDVKWAQVVISGKKYFGGVHVVEDSNDIVDEAFVQGGWFKEGVEVARSKAFEFKHGEVDVSKGDCKWGTHSSAFYLQPSTIPKGDVVVAEYVVCEVQNKVDSMGGNQCESKGFIELTESVFNIDRWIKTNNISCEYDRGGGV